MLLIELISKECPKQVFLIPRLQGWAFFPLPRDPGHLLVSYMPEKGNEFTWQERKNKSPFHLTYHEYWIVIWFCYQIREVDFIEIKGKLTYFSQPKGKPDTSKGSKWVKHWWPPKVLDKKRRECQAYHRTKVHATIY